VEASPTARGLRSQTVTTMRVRFGGCLEGVGRSRLKTTGSFPTVIAIAPF
jgi:hypothetical protein